MTIDEIDKLMSESSSFMKAFPSQGPALEQMSSMQHKIAGMELQTKSVRLLAEQHEKLKEVNEVLDSLSGRAGQLEIALQERKEVEDQRYKETMRFTRIAAAAAVISTVLATVGIILQIVVS